MAVSGINDCLFCGRYVLQVPGWTTQVMAYRMLRSPWDADNAFMGDGSFHFSCLRTFAHRAEFRADALLMLTSGDHDIDVAVGGEVVTSRRPGMAFTEQVFSGEAGDLFRHVNSDSWVFLEKEGPWHFLEAKDLLELAEKDTLRMSSGGERALLPRRAEGHIEQWSFTTLLDFLQVRDLYQGVLDRLGPEYTFLNYGELAPKFLLEYTVKCTQPLPEELVRFIATYTYRPRSLDWE
jgi:hypothetical protein